jgi:hypothetical protein
MSLTIQYYTRRLQDHFDGWITVVDVIISALTANYPPKTLVSVIIA